MEVEAGRTLFEVGLDRDKAVVVVDRKRSELPRPVDGPVVNEGPLIVTAVFEVHVTDEVLEPGILIGIRTFRPRHRGIARVPQQRQMVRADAANQRRGLRASGAPAPGFVFQAQAAAVRRGGRGHLAEAVDHGLRRGLRVVAAEGEGRDQMGAQALRPLAGPGQKLGQIG